MHWFLSFFCITLVFLITKCNAIGSVWQYSLRPIKPLKNTISKTPWKIHSHKTKSKQHEMKITQKLHDYDTIYDFIGRLSLRSFSMKLGKFKYTQLQRSGVISVPNLLFGYRNMAFLVHSNSERIRTISVNSTNLRKYLGNFLVESVGGKTGVSINIDIIFQEGTITLETHANSNGISDKDIEQMINLFESLLRREFERELQLLTARRAQAKATRKSFKITAKLTKQKELDKIIHPEKYRSKSATVRRVGSNNGAVASTSSRSATSGSSRYTPSSSTQARRQVKRG